MKRLEFSPHVKLAAWRRAEGKCEGCGQKIYGKNVPEYDHVREAWEGGDNSLDNCAVLGRFCCHRSKTTCATARRSKADAVAKKHAGIRRKQKPILGSRASGWKKKLDGTVERR